MRADIAVKIHILEGMKDATENYAQKIYDFADLTGHGEILGQLYDFTTAIEKMIEALQADAVLPEEEV